MKLLHEDIISLLGNSLKIKDAQAEDLLAEWVSSVEEEVKNKGEYYAAGLGIFFLEDGELSFKPEEELAIEVNYKYAGMNPIEILPAYTRKTDQDIQSDDGKSMLPGDSPSDQDQAGKSESEDEQHKFGESESSNEEDPISDSRSAGKVPDSDQDDFEWSGDFEESEGDFGIDDTNEFGDKRRNKVDDDDPFALGEDITDDILFGDQQEADSDDIDDLFDTEGSFDPFSEEELEETGPEKTEADEAVGEEEKSGRNDDLPRKDEQISESDPEENKAPDEVDGEANDESIDLDNEINVTEEEIFGSDSDDEIGEDEQTHPEEEAPYEPMPGTGESKPEFDTEDDIFGEDEIKSASEKEQDAEKEENTEKDEEIEKEESPLESPIGKTTGIGIRPPSRTLEKSGRKSGKAQRNDLKSKSGETAAEANEKVSTPLQPLEESGSKSKKTRSSSKKRGDSSSIIWLIPIAAALILAVMLFFHFKDQILDLRQDSPAVEESTIVLPQEEESEPPVEEEAEAEPPVQQLQETTEVDGSPFGLMGSEEEVKIGAYTIVLHSIVNENRARIEMSQLLNRGYKTTLWEARLPDGSTTWRVGVGQFESVSDAEQAVPELPEPFRSNNFIIRIR